MCFKFISCKSCVNDLKKKIQAVTLLSSINLLFLITWCKCVFLLPSILCFLINLDLLSTPPPPPHLPFPFLSYQIYFFSLFLSTELQVRYYIHRCNLFVLLYVIYIFIHICNLYILLIKCIVDYSSNQRGISNKLK